MAAQGVAAALPSPRASGGTWAAQSHQPFPQGAEDVFGPSPGCPARGQSRVVPE